MRRKILFLAAMLLSALGMQAVEEFKIEVTTTAASQSFALPTSGGNGGKSYNWNINWGDGSNSETKSGTSSAYSAGIAHTYATAGTYTITLTPAGSVDAWLAAFGFYSNITGANVATNKALVTKVISPITPLMTRTQTQINAGTAPDFEWYMTFHGCVNLTMDSNFTFSNAWDGITTVGNYFAYQMFFGCSSSAFNMNDVFNLPSGITTVGNYFAYSMFHNCSGSAFNMNDVFNLPAGITTVGDAYAISMFRNCSGTNFNMNDVFNLPSGITTVGDNFAAEMFRSCSGANFKVNNVFKFPVLSTTYLRKTGVFSSTFSDMGNASTQTRTASSIINGNEMPTDFYPRTFLSSACFSDLAYIPNRWGGGGQTPAVITLNTQPAATTAVEQGSISGSLSVAATATGSAVLSYQWYVNTTNNNTGGVLITGATAPAFAIPTTLGEGTYYYYCVVNATIGAMTKYSNVATVEVTALPEHYFRFEVTTTAASQSFALPTSGGNGNKSYNWSINWGDGNTETKSGTSNTTSAGIAHTYTTAGTYTITITPVGDNTTNGWLAAFGFSSTTTGANDATNKALVTRVISPITLLMTRTQTQIDDGTAPDYEWFRTFYGCVNLTMGSDFTFSNAWDNIATVGDHFARYMFYDCSGAAFTMNEVFNLPTGITTVGDNFASAMFYGCSGAAFNMNEVFNLPTGSITTVGDHFASSMFYGCSGAAFNMNEVFNLPTGITTVGTYFAQQMFYGCSGANFKVNDVFRFPVLATGEVNNKTNVFFQTFYNMGNKSTQIRTASSIINGNETPSSIKRTFTNSACFSDLADIPTQWGGLTPFVIEATETKTYAGYTASHGHIIFKSTDASTGQLTSIPAGGLTVNGVVKVVKTFDKKKWYTIGFPFNIAQVDGYGAFEGEPLETDRNLNAWNPEMADGDFWLRRYEGEDFVYKQTMEAGKGYAVKFPAAFANGGVVTFISEVNPTLKNTTGLTIPAGESEGDYVMLTNPSVNNINLTATSIYYLFNGTNDFTPMEEAATFKPFSALIMQKTDVPGGLRAISIEEIVTGLDDEPQAGLEEPISVHYYNLQGVEVQQPEKGNIYIVKKLYNSQRTEVTKMRL